jgi:hypothetical protein
VDVEAFDEPRLVDDVRTEGGGERDARALADGLGQGADVAGVAGDRPGPPAATMPAAMTTPIPK